MIVQINDTLWLNPQHVASIKETASSAATPRETLIRLADGTLHVVSMSGSKVAEFLSVATALQNASNLKQR